MSIQTIQKKPMKKTVWILLIVAALAAVGAWGLGLLRGEEATEPIAGATTEQREDYLASIGIQVDTKSAVAEVQVPAEFDERFASYNAMLQANGFDLEPLKGEVIRKCTYTVTNRPELGKKVSAVLLVSEGNVVAGHLLNEETGEIIPLLGAQAQPTASVSGETILPVETAPTAGITEIPEDLPESAYPTD